MCKLYEHTPLNFWVWVGLKNTHLSVRLKIWAIQQRTTDYYFQFSAIVTFPSPIEWPAGSLTYRSLILTRCKILSSSPNRPGNDTSHLPILPMLRMNEAIPPFPIILHVANVDTVPWPCIVLFIQIKGKAFFQSFYGSRPWPCVCRKDFLTSGSDSTTQMCHVLFVSVQSVLKTAAEYSSVFLMLGEGWSTHAPAALTLGSTRYPLCLTRIYSRYINSNHK